MTACNGHMGGFAKRRRQPMRSPAGHNCEAPPGEATVDTICGIFALVASQMPDEGSVYADDGPIPQGETLDEGADLETDEALTVMSWRELVGYARRGDLAEFHAGQEAIRRVEARLVRRGAIPERDSEGADGTSASP